GMRGIMVWQGPPDEMSFATKNYDALWAVCQDLQMPLSMHILTGAPFGPSPGLSTQATARLSFSVNKKIMFTCDSLMQILISGVLERFPQLKVVLVETEVSWLPYALSQWDRYFTKGNRHTGQLKLAPSEYFNRQVYATFFNDPPAGILFNK